MNSKDSSKGPDSTTLMLGYLCIATEKEASLDRKVEILDRFGLSDTEIARICKSVPQSIRNARYSLSKHAAKKKKTR